MGFALFMFIGLGLGIAFILGLISGYVGFLHWLLDRVAIFRHRRAQLRNAERDTRH